MNKLSLLFGLLAALAAAPASTGDPVNGTVFYTRFCGGVNVKSVDFDYDGVTFTLAAPVGITSTIGADGIIFAPDGDLIVGGQGARVHKVDPSNGFTVTVNPGTSVFHVMLDPDLRTVWGAAIPGILAEIPLNPFANGTPHAIGGDVSSVTHLAFPPGLPAFYTSSGAGGNGSFGTINLNTFTTTQILAPLAAAHGMAYDSFTGHLMLFGDSHITQIDPANPGVIVSDRTFAGFQFDQGTVDGNGHAFVASNGGNLFFIDYSATSLIGDLTNFVATPFLDSCLDDVAPLSGLGAPSAVSS